MDNLLLSSVESAFSSLITAAIGSQANVYTGKASTNKVLPCVICIADGEEQEDPPFTGNYWVSVEIQVKYHADTAPGLSDPKVADLTLVRNVFNAVKVSNLDALLNGQGQNLTVFPNGFFFSSQKAGQDEMGAWADVQPIKLYCCASVIAP